MSTAGDNNNDNVSDICANCGKGEDSSGSLKACAACKLVKYCNRECQIAHRSQHKKECKKRAVELHDEKLFESPPLEYEDCPICLLRCLIFIQVGDTCHVVESYMQWMYSCSSNERRGYWTMSIL